VPFRRPMFRFFPNTKRSLVIQQVASAAFNPALRHAVLPGAFEGRSHWTHLQRSNGCENLQPVFRIPIEDQKPRTRLEWKCFPQLLNDPQGGRMLRDVEVQDASTIVADDEKAVEYGRS